MSLVPYRALVVSNKPTLESTIGIILKKAGIEHFTFTMSFREVISKVSQEIPHMIVIMDEAVDASAFQIIENIRQKPQLNPALLFLIKACSQQEIMQALKLKVTAVIAKNNDPNAYIEKIKSKVDALNGLSPYAIRGDALPGGIKGAVKVSGKIIGKANKHLVCQSTVSAPTGTTVSIFPDNKLLDSFMVTFAAESEEQAADKSFNNIFPLSGIIGKGRAWLNEKLAEIEDAGTAKKKRLLIFERVRERIENLKKALKYYGIESDNVENISDLCNTVRTRVDDFAAVYLSEPIIGSIGIPWDKAKQEVLANKAVLEIIATTALAPPQKSKVIWLRKPFGIEQIVQSFNSANAMSQLGVAETTKIKSVPCKFLAPISIVALDEVGGLFTSELKPALGTEIILSHSFINEDPLFGDAKVIGVMPNPENTSYNIIRFAFNNAIASKEKYWTSVNGMFESFRKK